MTKKSNNQNRVQAGQKHTLPFEKGWKALRVRDQKHVKVSICQYLAVGEGMFNMLKKGHRSLSTIQKIFIENLFAKYGVNAWTGEILTEEPKPELK